MQQTLGDSAQCYVTVPFRTPNEFEEWWSIRDFTQNLAMWCRRPNACGIVKSFTEVREVKKLLTYRHLHWCHLIPLLADYFVGRGHIACGTSSMCSEDKSSNVWPTLWKRVQPEFVKLITRTKYWPWVGQKRTSFPLLNRLCVVTLVGKLKASGDSDAESVLIYWSCGLRLRLPSVITSDVTDPLCSHLSCERHEKDARSLL